MYLLIYFVDRKILNLKFKKSYAIFDGFKYDSKNVNPGRAYFCVKFYVTQTDDFVKYIGIHKVVDPDN